MTAAGAGAARPRPIGLTELATAPIPVAGTLLQLTVFGRQDAAGRNVEEVAALCPLGARPPGVIPMVRVHSACFTGDIFGSEKCDCGPQLQRALDRIIDVGYGAVLYMLRQEGRGIGLANKIRAYALQTQGHDTVSANTALGLPVDTRDFGIAAEALHLLGMPRVRLLTNNPEKIRQLQQHGIDVARRLPLAGFVTEHNLSYLTVKDRMLGHLNSTGSDVPDD